MKPKIKTKNFIKKNRSNKKTIKRKKYNKQLRYIKKYMKENKKMHGGERELFEISVDEDRFDIQLKRQEATDGSKIIRYNFIIITDKNTNQKYIITTATNKFNLYLFETLDLGNNKEKLKVYVYYITYERRPHIEPYGEDPYLPIDPYLEREIKIIERTDLSLPQIIDNVAMVQRTIPNICINLTGMDSHIVTSRYNLNLDIAKLRIQELNAKLQIRCPTLELRLDYLINQPGILTAYYTPKELTNQLTLCLYNQGNCIASIMCELTSSSGDPQSFPDAFEILSATNLSMENRKFNKLLRAAVIIISNLITINDTDNNINYIISKAINPASAWLLINYYNAEIVDPLFLDYIDQEKYQEKLILQSLKRQKTSMSSYETDEPKERVSKKIIQNYLDIDRTYKIETRIQLNDENVLKATREFNLLVSSRDETDEKYLINCENLERAWDTR
jgi:hypothetical protein